MSAKNIPCPNFATTYQYFRFTLLFTQNISCQNLVTSRHSPFGSCSCSHRIFHVETIHAGWPRLKMPFMSKLRAFSCANFTTSLSLRASRTTFAKDNDTRTCHPRRRGGGEREKKKKPRRGQITTASFGLSRISSDSAVYVSTSPLSTRHPAIPKMQLGFRSSGIA